MSEEVKFSWTLPIVLIPKEKWVLVSCPVLDIHSQGKDDAEARHNIIEAITLFTESCLERGTLDEVMRDCGFRVHKTNIKIEKPRRPSRQQYVDVPISLIASCYAH